MQNQYKNPYLEFPFSIPANGRIEIACMGRHISCLELTGSVNFQLEHFEVTTLRKGIAFSLPDEMEDFAIIALVNTSGSTATGVLAFSNGYVDDRRLTLTSAIQVNGGGSISTPAAVTVTTTATSLIAANTNATSRMVQNNGANNLWVGDSAVDGAVNRGILVLPGQSLVVPSTAQLWGRTTTGTTTASIMEIAV